MATTFTPTAQLMKSSAQAATDVIVIGTLIFSVYTLGKLGNDLLSELDKKRIARNAAKNEK